MESNENGIFPSSSFHHQITLNITREKETVNLSESSQSDDEPDEMNYDDYTSNLQAFGGEKYSRWSEEESGSDNIPTFGLSSSNNDSVN